MEPSTDRSLPDPRSQGGTPAFTDRRRRARCEDHEGPEQDCRRFEVAKPPAMALSLAGSEALARGRDRTSPVSSKHQALTRPGAGREARTLLAPARPGTEDRVAARGSARAMRPMRSPSERNARTALAVTKERDSAEHWRPRPRDGRSTLPCRDCGCQEKRRRSLTAERSRGACTANVAER